MQSCHPWAGAALAALLFAISPNAVRAAENATNPGFNPQTGQINPGTPVPESAPHRTNIPTAAEGRAALLKLRSAAQDKAGNNGSGTTGSAPPGEMGATVPSPPGATPQTMPAKFSKENDTLDRLPIMAFPLALDDAQVKRVYQAAMDDKGGAASDAGKLAPASALTPQQALEETHPLPQAIADIAAVKGLKYLKTKDKVFLADPATRTVVDEIANSPDQSQ